MILTNLLSTSSIQIVTGATFAAGEYTFPRGEFCMLNQTMPTPVVGHKYYGRVEQKVPADTSFSDGRFEYYRTDVPGTGLISFTSFFEAVQDNQYHTYSSILEFPDLYSQEGWIMRSFTVDGSNTVYRKNHMIIDLTAAFGAGNEPPKEMLDRLIPYFEGTYNYESKILFGVNGIAKKFKTGYAEVDGRSSRLRAGYLGVNGLSQSIFPTTCYEKYSLAYTWGVVTLGEVSSSGFKNEWGRYLLSTPPFDPESETKPKFDYTGGTSSKSLENGLYERVWAADDHSLILKVNESAADGITESDYFIILTKAETYLSIFWNYSGYISTIDRVATRRGNYIESVFAYDGDYPDNGEQDGYWWVKRTVTKNKALDKGVLVDAPGWITTDFLPLPKGCTRITIEAGESRNSGDCLDEYNTNKGYLSYWGASANPRTFNLDYPNDTKFIRATVKESMLARCYIYDDTHGSYIWKG